MKKQDPIKSILTTWRKRHTKLKLLVRRANPHAYWVHQVTGRIKAYEVAIEELDHQLKGSR